MEQFSYMPPGLALHSLSMDNYLGLPFHLDPVRAQGFPYGRFSYLNLHHGMCDYSFEPAFIRKRNERERHRVRCVNEGYARLREHLPQELEDKRLSKVETLRAAIDYIKHLQSLLDAKVPHRGGDVRKSAQTTERSSDGESRSGLSDSGEIIY